jgi:hypothetical protein
MQFRIVQERVEICRLLHDQREVIQRCRHVNVRILDLLRYRGDPGLIKDDVIKVIVILWFKLV